MPRIQGFFPPRRREPEDAANASRLLLQRWAEPRRGTPFVFVYSEEILDEYKAVLNRLGILDAPVGPLIAAIRRGGVRVEPTGPEGASPDPADNIFFAAARASVAAIVTSNRKHFPDGRGVRILSPEQAIAEFR